MDLIIRYINVFLDLYILCIVAWALMSWFTIPFNSPLRAVRSFLDDIVLPYMRLFRGVVPMVGGLDLSPMIAIFALLILQRILLALT